MALPITWVIDPRGDQTLHALRAGQQTYCGLRPQRSPITPGSPGQWIIVRQPESIRARCLTCLAAVGHHSDDGGV